MLSSNFVRAAHPDPQGLNLLVQLFGKGGGGAEFKAVV